MKLSKVNLDSNELNVSANFSQSEAALLDSYIEVGRWYWVKSDSDELEWFGCAMEIGSNYVRIEEPHINNRGFRNSRIHFDDIYTYLRAEANPNLIIQKNVQHYQSQVSKHLEEIKQVTSRLGVSRQSKLSNGAQQQTRTDVAVVSGQFDIKGYEANLIRARQEELPSLFEAVKQANAHVAMWMGAEMMPMLAQTQILEGSLSDISERIFNVSLYAGLIESVVQCQDGESAPYHEKLRVMQRMLFMDEECLLGYRTGGLDFDGINQFDEWLCEPENLNRILPFQRCIVAMRVRRNPKERDWKGDIRILFNNIAKQNSDKWTFLYIRNGEKVYRLESDGFEFDAENDFLFPAKDAFNPSEPMMTNGYNLMKVSEFEVRVKESQRLEENYHQWIADHPLETWKAYDPKEEKHGKERIEWLWNDANPHVDAYQSRFRCVGWEEFKPSYIYYDDILHGISTRLSKFNRIALLIQGLFDRSEVFHPHPTVKTWEPKSFAESIELVYDGSGVLNYGEEPDIDAYIQKCNSSLKPGMIAVGQDDYWQRMEANKECRRLDNDWRVSSSYRPERFKPRGNPGPGYLAHVESVGKKGAVAQFVWHRRSRACDQYGDRILIKAAIKVPVSELFNISAYAPGDFKQFFRDPRTRAKYLRWAPLLIAAEEYYAGNLAVGPIGS